VPDLRRFSDFRREVASATGDRPGDLAAGPIPGYRKWVNPYSESPMPRLTRRACGCFAIAALLSCSSNGGTTTTPTVATISVSQTSASLALGATIQLIANPLDATGTVVTGQTITWSTSSSGVATVSTNGLVTAVAVGTATITASAGGKSAQVAITVATQVASVTLSQSAAALVPAATVQLTATPKDAAGATVTGQTVTWTTNAGNVATVSSNGLVTAVAVGTATITATMGTKSATAVITVNAGAVIGAAGGTVTSADGNASVTIPAGALSSATNIAIVPTVAAPTTPVAVGQGYDLLPSGTTFTAPVTIKLKYNAASVPAGHAAGALQMRTQVGNAWNALADPIVVDSVAHTVSATSTHFSTYIITDPRLTFGIRDGDAYTAVRASSANITLCLGDTKRVVVLFYDQTLTTPTPSYSWGPGPWNLGLGSEVASPTAYGVNVTISGGALGGPTALVVTSNGESATLYVTVINCMAPAITYTRDFGGSDNAYLYQGGGNSALTTDNATSKSSTIPSGLGAVGVLRTSNNRQVNYYGVGWNLRANLRAPIYTTTGFLEGFNWVSPTLWEFAEGPTEFGSYQLFRMNTDGTGKVPFAAAGTAGGSARTPYLAGNGFTYFAYLPTPSTSQVYRVDANGNNMTQVVTVNGLAWTPVVSQDGQWLVVSVYNNAFTAAQLLMYDLTNLQAAPIPISPATGFAQFPSFCSNGALYYTYSTTNLSNSVWTLYRWDIASRTSTAASFVASGSIPEGVSVQPQKGTSDRSCPN